MLNKPYTTYNAIFVLHSHELGEVMGIQMTHRKSRLSGLKMYRILEITG